MLFKAVLICCAIYATADTSINFPIDCSDKPNEIYACGGACQTECATLGEECKIINIRCNDACYCIEGYARNESGTCIPIAECPEKNPIDCSDLPNEHYECGSACQTECATLGEMCEVINKKCNEGCYCDEGYARGSCGTCIPVENCPIKKLDHIINQD